MNKDLRPEDFWPEAEKLLDNHYKAKRKRRAILWFDRDKYNFTGRS